MVLAILLAAGSYPYEILEHMRGEN